MWERAADVAGVPRFTLMGVLGGLAARGDHHDGVWSILGVEHPAVDLGGRATGIPTPCRRSRRSATAATSSGPSATRRSRPRSCFGPHVDFVGSSARWGVAKPEPAFFARLIAEAGAPPEKIAYVGDRVDNDILPALDAGLVAVHIRRGPWGLLHETPRRRDRDPVARRAARGARDEHARGDRCRRARARRRRAARPRWRHVRPSARACRPLRRRRARARADRRAARRSRARRHRLAVPVRRRALSRCRQHRPAARGLPSRARGRLGARQRGLRPRRRGAEDRRASRGDASAPVGGCRRR